MCAWRCGVCRRAREGFTQPPSARGGQGGVVCVAVRRSHEEITHARAHTHTHTHTQVNDGPLYTAADWAMSGGAWSQSYINSLFIAFNAIHIVNALQYAWSWHGRRWYEPVLWVRGCAGEGRGGGAAAAIAATLLVAASHHAEQRSPSLSHLSHTCSLSTSMCSDPSCT